MTSTELMGLLESLYLWLDGNFNSLFKCCMDDTQRGLLRKAYVNARDNYWEARNRVFHENDPLVAQAAQELANTKSEIDQFQIEESNIAAILGLIANAVHLGSSLITLGSGV